MKLRLQATINLYEHCHACTVNDGSSCHGALIKDNHQNQNVKENIKAYYGRELQSNAGLKTTACCTTDSIPGYIKEVLPAIVDEVKIKYYGCGSPIPLVLNGLKVLDVGCGTGRDSFILSKLVGKNGCVAGLDMTEEQITVAKKYIKEHTKRFDYKKPNVLFFHDFDEHFGEFKDCGGPGTSDKGDASSESCC